MTRTRGRGELPRHEPVESDTAVCLRSRATIARHEAAHLIVAASLGIRPVGALLLPGGRGVAFHDPCDAWHEAVIAAGGLHADRIAPIEAAPAEPAGDATPAGEAPEPAAHAVALPVFVFRDAVCAADDAATIAVYATCSPNWRDWTPRAERVVNIAAAILAKSQNERLWRRLTATLYVYGKLDEADLDGIVAVDEPIRLSDITRRDDDESDRSG